MTEQPKVVRLFLFEDRNDDIPAECLDLPPEEGFERAMHWINEPGHPYRTWAVGPAE